MDHKYEIEQVVRYKKNGQLMKVISWEFDGKPGGPLYLCSDSLKHREWNLEPVSEDEAKKWEPTKKVNLMALGDFIQGPNIKVSLSPGKGNCGHGNCPVTLEIEKLCAKFRKEHAITKWGINPDLKLLTFASDFYLLNEISTDILPLKEFYNRKASELENQFTAYLAMVIGGELRHTRTMLNAPWVSKNVLAVLKEICKHYTDVVYRADAWYRWGDIYLPRDRQGRINLLHTARRIFRRGKWGRAFGGNNWSLITKTLLDYLEGKTTSITFIDTVFGLYHNCNLVLDKIWDVRDLKRILDANFKHDMILLYQKASKEVKGIVSIYRRWKHDD